MDYKSRCSRWRTYVHRYPAVKLVSGTGVECRRRAGVHVRRFTGTRRPVDSFGFDLQPGMQIHRLYIIFGSNPYVIVVPMLAYIAAFGVHGFFVLYEQVLTSVS